MSNKPPSPYLLILLNLGLMFVGILMTVAIFVIHNTFALMAGGFLLITFLCRKKPRDFRNFGLIAIAFTIAAIATYFVA